MAIERPSTSRPALFRLRSVLPDTFARGSAVIQSRLDCDGDGRVEDVLGV